MYAAGNRMLCLLQNCHISFATALYCTEWLVPIFDPQATAVVLSIINLTWMLTFSLTKDCKASKAAFSSKTFMLLCAVYNPTDHLFDLFHRNNPSLSMRRLWTGQNQARYDLSEHHWKTTWYFLSTISFLTLLHLRKLLLIHSLLYSA